MDTIQFERITVRNYAVWVCAKILINGIPLLDTVCNYEKAHISYDKAYEPSYQHSCAVELYNQIHEALTAKKKTQVYLLVCTCMEAGCNSIDAYLHETEKSIVLSGFQNYRFAKKKEYNDIDYTAFGTYRFDKVQFMSEVEKLKTFSPSDKNCLDWDSPE
jgi:hypothetical protein